MWLWIVLGGVVVVVIVAFVILLAVAMKRGLAKGNAELQAALTTLEVPEINDRASECVATAREKLGIDLDPEDWQTSAKHLDDFLSNREKKRVVLRAFEKPGLSYNGFIALGAFLGKLLERHANAPWKKEGGTPYMDVPVGDGTMTTWPFDKVQKQFWEGAPGDLVAYVAMNVNTDAIAARLRQS